MVNHYPSRYGRLHFVGFGWLDYRMFPWHLRIRSYRCEDEKNVSKRIFKLADIETGKDWRIQRALYLFQDHMIFKKNLAFFTSNLFLVGKARSLSS